MATKKKSEGLGALNKDQLVLYEALMSIAENDTKAYTNKSPTMAVRAAFQVYLARRERELRDDFGPVMGPLIRTLSDRWEATWRKPKAEGPTQQELLDGGDDAEA